MVSIAEHLRQYAVGERELVLAPDLTRWWSLGPDMFDGWSVWASSDTPGQPGIWFAERADALKYIRKEMNDAASTSGVSRAE